jgi:hypothetical protein
VPGQSFEDLPQQLSQIRVQLLLPILWYPQDVVFTLPLGVI